MALAMSTSWRHSVNCAFEAVESHRLSRLCDAECLVVVVTAELANCHIKLPFRLQRVYLGATASRLLPAGWSSRVIRMQVVSVHPLGDEAIILMPDKNLWCMTVLSVLFG
jgi:hypothetical protein